MKRIIVGEYNSLKQIEKILSKEKYNFGVFVDFESLRYYGLKNFQIDEIIIYLEDIEVFNRHYEFISTNKNRICLLLKSKTLRKNSMFLNNEGYRIIEKLDELNICGVKVEKPLKKNYLSKVISIVGSYEIAFKLAYILSEISEMKILFIDTDPECSFTMKRLKKSHSDEIHYLNEFLNFEKKIKCYKYDSLSILPIVENTNLENTEMLNKLSELIMRNKSIYDVQIIYCNKDMPLTLKKMYGISTKEVIVTRLDFESIVSVNSFIKKHEMENDISAVVLNNTNFKYNYLLAQRTLNAKIIGIVGEKIIFENSRMNRWINLKKMKKKEKRKYIKLIKELM